MYRALLAPGPVKGGSGNRQNPSACYNYGKPNHYAQDCCALPHKYHVIKKYDYPSPVIVMILHIFHVENDFDWWIDIGATCHICYNCNLFNNYELMDGLKVLIRNQVRKLILSREKVLLRISSKRTVLLTDVLHVLAIQNNLIPTTSLLAHLDS